MKYRIQKGNKPTLPSFGKYTAKAVHTQTVDFQTVREDMRHGSGLSDGTVDAVLKDFFNALTNRLRNGDIVEIPQIGTFKMEIESHTFEHPEDFDPKQHIKRFSLHLLPKCSGGTPKLYQDVRLEKAE